MFQVLTQKEALKAKSPSPVRESSPKNTNNESKVSYYIFVFIVGNIMDIEYMDIVRVLFKVLNRLVDSTTLNL